PRRHAARERVLAGGAADRRDYGRPDDERRSRRRPAVAPADPGSGERPLRPRHVHRLRPAAGRSRHPGHALRPGSAVSSAAVNQDGLRRAVAEFVGTFALVFVAVGALMSTGGEAVAVALGSGLAIAVMASAVGHISGAHFNPAVTLGFVVTRRMSVRL